MDFLLITGGSIDFCFGLRILRSKKWDRVIAADRGMDFCKKAQIVPDHILGDFDSASGIVLEHFKRICPKAIESFPVRKDATDTELAVHYAINMGAESITILGGTGTRLDHVFANIQVLKGALELGVRCEIVDPHNRIRLIDKGLIIKKEEQFGDYISLIPFTPSVQGITAEGVSYELHDRTLKSGNSLGVSNFITGDTARITIKDGLLLVIESTDKALNS